MYIIENKETLAKYRRICYDTYTVRQKQPRTSGCLIFQVSGSSPGFSPAPCRRLPIPPSNTSILSFQSSVYPCQLPLCFCFLLIYLSGTGSFCLNRLTALFHTARRYLRYSDDRRHRLGRHHQKTFRQCNPHRLFRFQYPAEIRLARKRQISITWRKAGTQMESFFCCLRF